MPVFLIRQWFLACSIPCSIALLAAWPPRPPTSCSYHINFPTHAIACLYRPQRAPLYALLNCIWFVCGSTMLHRCTIQQIRPSHVGMTSQSRFVALDDSIAGWAVLQPRALLSAEMWEVDSRPLLSAECCRATYASCRDVGGCMGYTSAARYLQRNAPSNTACLATARRIPAWQQAVRCAVCCMPARPRLAQLWKRLPKNVGCCSWSSLRDSCANQSWRW
jgi:hypothetical protein